MAMVNPFIYSNTNKRYHTLDYFYKQKFGKKISKVSLNAGFTCPNKDGTRGFGGCIYCSKSGSGDFAGNPKSDVVEQFMEIKKMMDAKWPEASYIGYFQANTNTYASVNQLKEKFEPILALDQVVGLSIATRCDAIDDDCLEYLDDLNKRTFLTVELGLQTIHEETSKFIRRGHTLEEFENMVQKLRSRNISVVVHIMNGLPNETKEMMLDTIRYVNSLDIQGIKIHMLHVIKDTDLATIYEKEPFPLLSRDEYIELVCDQLELLRKEIVIHRLTGDPVKEELIAPEWTIKKIDVLNGIDKELARRDSWQGKGLKPDVLYFQNSRT